MRVKGDRPGRSMQRRYSKSGSHARRAHESSWSSNPTPGRWFGGPSGTILTAFFCGWSGSHC